MADLPRMQGGTLSEDSVYSESYEGMNRDWAT